MMQYEQAKKDYLNWLRHEAKKAETTHTTYQSWLNRYGRCLETYGFTAPDIHCAFNTTNLLRYQYELDGQGLRPRTMRSAFGALRSMADFLVNHVHVFEKNPVKDLTMLGKDAAIRLLVSDTEAMALLDAAQRQIVAAKIALSGALISALLYTGVRASELVNMRVQDVSLERGELLVFQGKGNKSRTLYPAPEFFTAVDVWLNERKKLNSEIDRLWARGKRESISYDWLLNHINELAAIAGYKGAKNIKPHSIRHWFATNLYRQTGNIHAVQLALGHANAETTLIYLHAGEEEARAMSTMTLPTPAGIGAKRSMGQVDAGRAAVKSPLGRPIPSQVGDYRLQRRQGRRTPTRMT